MNIVLRQVVERMAEEQTSMSATLQEASESVRHMANLLQQRHREREREAEHRRPGKEGRGEEGGRMRGDDGFGRCGRRGVTVLTCIYVCGCFVCVCVDSRRAQPHPWARAGEARGS